MSDFTDQDRMMMQETHTLLRAHVKSSDERHADTMKKLEDHESRIRKNTSFRTWCIGLFATGASGTGLVATLKSFLGN